MRDDGSKVFFSVKFEIITFPDFCTWKLRRSESRFAMEKLKVKEKTPFVLYFTQFFCADFESEVLFSKFSRFNGPNQGFRCQIWSFS